MSAVLSTPLKCLHCSIGDRSIIFATRFLAKTGLLFLKTVTQNINNEKLSTYFESGKSGQVFWSTGDASGTSSNVPFNISNDYVEVSPQSEIFESSKIRGKQVDQFQELKNFMIIFDIFSFWLKTLKVENLTMLVIAKTFVFKFKIRLIGFLFFSDLFAT